MKRILVNRTGTSNKFWSAEDKGPGTLEVRWGRIGLAGQSQTKTFSNEYSKSRWLEGKIAEKMAEGYIEETEDNLQKEKDTAQAIGTQYKITRMEFVSMQMGKTFSFGKQYTPENGVVVEITNSWSKETTHLYLNRTDSWRLSNAQFKGDEMVVTRMEETHADSWVTAVRKLLRDIAQAVSKIVVQTFGALGVRKLCFGDDDSEEETAAVQRAVAQASKLSDASSLGEQTLFKFACMGNRALEI